MTKEHTPWQTTASNIEHTNPWWQLRHDSFIRPDGTLGDYYVVESTPAVFVVPIDEDKHVHLIRIYRYPVKRLSLEVPAGNTDGEDPLYAAKRELREEIGLQAEHWQKVGTFFPANGLMTEQNTIFIATGLSSVGSDEGASEGIVEVIKVPLAECLRMVKSGEIVDGQTIASLLHAALELDVVRIAD